MPQAVGHETMHMTWRAFDLLGVRYYCTPREWQAPPGWRLATTREGTRIYENQDALPRAFLARESRWIHAGLDRTFLDPAWDPAVTVFLEEQGAGLPGPACHQGEARIIEDRPNRVVVESRADGWSWLVLMDNHYPGWRARLADGKELEVRRAYGVWRCVALPPGRQQVTFAYEPASWRWGLNLALAGGLLLLMCLVMAGRTRRDHGLPPVS